MSVCLYYRATRAEPLTEVEAAAVQRIVAVHLDTFPYDDEESLYLYDRLSEPDEILDGSTKLPRDLDRIMPVLDHVLGSVTELRKAVPGAQWHVHVDDVYLPWDEAAGYVLPE